jgi:hypothetical protein
MTPWELLHHLALSARDDAAMPERADSPRCAQALHGNRPIRATQQTSDVTGCGFSSVPNCRSSQFCSDKLAAFRSSGMQLRRGQLVWQVRPRIVQTQAAASELANQRASLLGT